jgi:hypothetical protein
MPENNRERDSCSESEIKNSGESGKPEGNESAIARKLESLLNEGNPSRDTPAQSEVQDSKLQNLLDNRAKEVPNQSQDVLEALIGLSRTVQDKQELKNEEIFQNKEPNPPQRGNELQSEAEGLSKQAALALDNLAEELGPLKSRAVSNYEQKHPHSLEQENKSLQEKTAKRQVDAAIGVDASQHHIDIEKIPVRYITEDSYKRIRETTEDLAILSQYTGFQEEEISVAKHHYMSIEHILRDDETGQLYKGRFTPDHGVATLWERVIDGKELTDNQKEYLRQLIDHEFHEAQYLKENGERLLELFKNGKLDDEFQRYLDRLPGMAETAKAKLFNFEKPVTPYRFAHIATVKNGHVNPDDLLLEKERNDERFKWPKSKQFN